MSKSYFHNDKFIIENNKKKILNPTVNVKTKSVVDINILLNRVKLEEKSEIKRKIIFYSLVTLLLTIIGMFIAIMK
tara:strand:- start:152 stop:379 length:228 start_codon:yes stop_codon:yes gene_type:complete